MQDTSIRVENLNSSYAEGDNGVRVPVLKNLNLEIQKGQFVSVIGHNGSGKSTFAKLLNMILEPDSGKIFVDGTEITSLEKEEDILAIRRKVGMVFQNPDNQLVATTVEEDVAFGPENLGVAPDEIRRRVDTALETVGMTAYAKHEPNRLSGGQKQRVAIAGILAMMPEYMVFDESTAMLDPVGRQEIMDTVLKLNREQGITVIMITHEMSEAAMSDRIIVLNDGEVYMDATPDEVFSHADELRNIGLDVPQCTQLVQSLCGGDSIISGISTPHGCAEYLAKYLEGEV